MFCQLTIFIVALIVGINAFTSRIINGEDDVIENRPYMVAVEYNGVQKCGGSIVSKRYILTAGHCIHPDYALDLLVVRSGSSFWQTGGSLSHIEDYHRPSDFSGIKRSDIALIKLKEPLEFGPTRQPIELFDANDDAKPGVTAVVSGWGETMKIKWNKRLQSVTVPIVDTNSCAKSYEDLNDGQICAGYFDRGGKDACQGDSGGPLVIEGRQAGVVSWGMGCARPRYPGIYTKVAHFREWIDGYVTREN